MLGQVQAMWCKASGSGWKILSFYLTLPGISVDVCRMLQVDAHWEAGKEKV